MDKRVTLGTRFRFIHETVSRWTNGCVYQYLSNGIYSGITTNYYSGSLDSIGSGWINQQGYKDPNFDEYFISLDDERINKINLLMLEEERDKNISLLLE
jgi:hypothetical protein